MKCRGAIICVLAAVLLNASAATAAVQTARLGAVTATFEFRGMYPSFRDETITIVGPGNAAYRQPVVSRFCGRQCQPVSRVGGQSSLRVIDLERDGQPDVVLRLYSGGAHCCWIDQVFSFDSSTITYVKTEHDFGDPGERIADINHNGRYEFITADDAFAGAFTDFAASAMPVRILTFSGRHFHDVTRSFPKLVAMDAATWLRAFNNTAKQHHQDSVGVLAAWAADEDLLGHQRLVSRFIARQLQAGHINYAFHRVEATFPARLNRFLAHRAHGSCRPGTSTTPSTGWKRRSRHD